MPDSKLAWQSKTYGVNLALAALVELHPAVAPWVATHPQTTVLVISGVNLLLRHLTTDPVVFWRKKIP